VLLLDRMVILLLGIRLLMHRLLVELLLVGVTLLACKLLGLVRVGHGNLPESLGTWSLLIVGRVVHRLLSRWLE